MNVLFLYRIYPSYGGVEVVTTLLANEFIKGGHNVIIASFERGDNGILKQLDAKVQILELNFPIFSLTNISKIRSYNKIHCFDVIINQWGLPFYTSLFIKISLPSVPLVSVLHGSPIVAKTLLQTEAKIGNTRSIPKQYVLKLVLSFKRHVIKYGILYNLKVNRTYILLSNSFIPILENFVGKKHFKNLIAINNPITIDTDYSMHQSEKEHNILYVGRMDFHNKRVDRIIDFWERNCEKLPNWTLSMVGDGPYKSQIEDKAKKLTRVQLYPFTEKPPIDYYIKSDVLLLTSDLEGFGLVVIEAMSYGVIPIVYGSYEAIYDIIDNGQCGIITKRPFNNAEFDEAVYEVCTNDNKRYVLSKNAVIKSKKFSIESIMDIWYSVINNAKKIDK